MKKGKIYSWIVLVILWQIVAMSVQNNILIPYPLEVLETLFGNIQEMIFYQTILTTLTRVAIGFFCSFFVALVISIVSSQFLFFRYLFDPIQVLTKSIPNISYIIITLIWFGSEASVSIVCFLVLFPVLYNAFLHALDSEPQELKDIEKIYPESFLSKTRLSTIPMLIPTMLSSGKVAAGLGLKVSVMAEILGQVRVGIGKQLYLSRINLDTAGLFAWTMVIIALCFIIDWIFDQFINRT
ncbi:MAG: ABC transporter permease [Anaerorhabdus sp.]